MVVVNPSEATSPNAAEPDQPQGAADLLHGERPPERNRTNHLSQANAKAIGLPIHAPSDWPSSTVRSCTPGYGVEAPHTGVVPAADNPPTAQERVAMGESPLDYEHGLVSSGASPHRVWNDPIGSPVTTSDHIAGPGSSDS